MSSPVESLTSDPIATLMPRCTDPAEPEARRRLMLARELSSAKVPHLPPGHALQLFWLIIEAATAWVYAPATLEQLDDVVRYCRRLLLCARSAHSRDGAQEAPPECAEQVGRHP